VSHVGFIFHAEVSGKDRQIEAARGWLEQRGFEVWEHPRRADPDSLSGRMPATKLLVTFGGDGTLLWAAREAAPAGVPLLGVNMGRLGFLAEVELSGLEQALERWTRGQFRLEGRTLLEASLGHPEQPAEENRHLALNDVMFHRGQRMHLVRFEVAVDHEPVGAFEADGILVSTATGSTGYGLSMGGPIVHPRVRDLIFTPVNPHSLFNRAVVLPPDSAIDVRLPDEAGILTCDGQTAIPVPRGEPVHVKAAANDAQLVRFRTAPHFFDLLRKKIRWGIPLTEPTE